LGCHIKGGTELQIFRKRVAEEKFAPNTEEKKAAKFCIMSSFMVRTVVKHNYGDHIKRRIRRAEYVSVTGEEEGLQDFDWRTSRKQTVWRRMRSWEEMSDGRTSVESIWLRIRTSCSIL
jgi:hypothetical protein